MNATEKTQKWVQDLLSKHNGNRESLARWMRDSLCIGGLKHCRALIDWYCPKAGA